MKRGDTKIFVEGLTLEDQGPPLGAKGLEPIKLNSLLFSVGVNYFQCKQKHSRSREYTLLAKLYLKLTRKCCVKEADIRIV